MIAKNIAPWILRTFAFERFARYDPKYLKWELETAKNKMMLDKHHTIIASDIDPEMIKIAQENAKNAGVEKYIHFETKDIKDYVDGPQLVGAMVSNPPYGLRLNIVDAQSLYKTIAELFKKNPQLHGWIITSYQQFDEMKWSGNRKKSPLYNGGEQCRFYKKSLL